MGRFINQDDIAYLDFESIKGLNLYAYCLNNSVMLYDSTGCSPTKWCDWVIAGGISQLGLTFAGAKNAKAIDNAKRVKKTTNHFEKIATKIANGNKSRSIANATKLLSLAKKDQKLLMFAGSMTWSASLTLLSNVVYMLGNENNLWPF